MTQYIDMADGDLGTMHDEIRHSARRLFRTGSDLTAAELVRQGWPELMDAAPTVTVATLAEEAGRALAPTSLLQLLMRRLVGGSSDLINATILLPLSGIEVRPAGAYLTVDGLVIGPDHPSKALVVPIAGHEAGWGTVDADGLTVEPVEGIDPTLPMWRLRGRVAYEELSLSASWVATRAMAQLHLAWEIIGCAESMLATACEYVGVREQFGRPLGSFQAVQHRLADVRIAIDAARATAEFASEEQPCHAAAALLLAGRASSNATQHCMQVMGGIACTWEHDMHRYVRRTIALGAVFDSEQQSAWLANELARSGAMPDAEAF